MNKLKLYLNDYYTELKNKVDWPKYEELQSHTITVLVASFIIAVIISLMDLAFNTSLKFVYDLFQ